VTEVKDEDFFKGITQNAVQLESALSNRKHKASEMEEDSVFVGRVFGIVTDAEKWYFLECSLDYQDRLDVMYHGQSPEHLYLFFACNNKIFFLAKVIIVHAHVIFYLELSMLF